MLKNEKMIDAFLSGYGQNFDFDLNHFSETVNVVTFQLCMVIGLTVALIEPFLFIAVGGPWKLHRGRTDSSISGGI